ncbi:MAG: scaffold protein [Microviridae sp. ctD0m35]|nr:MAG: scaffold protein [Microviridae sp. ctudC31]QGH72988.1 MAG: scaffold protein [Microviridae sp. ctD0m35]
MPKIRNRVKLSFDILDEKGNPHPSVRSRTKQSFADAVNINIIVKKIARTGLAPQKSGAFYGDFSSGDDYQTALQKIQNADEAFMSLPVDIRTRFQNDPSQLLNFLADPKNLEEAVKLGLMDKSLLPATSPLGNGKTKEQIDMEAKQAAAAAAAAASGG